MSQLRDKRVLVTGASSGFGRAIAIEFARAGSHVALFGRRQAALREVAAVVEAEGRAAAVCVADAADEAQLLTAVADARAALGGIDVLVNNAGMNVRERSIVATSAEQWRTLLEVNLTSAFVLTKAVLGEMIDRREGTIINVASRAALIPDLAGGVAYSTSKIGLEALTKVTNEEGNRHNVRACLFCPGLTNTPLVDRRPSPPPPEQRTTMLQVDDIAATVVFVAGLPPRANIELVSMKPTHI